MVGKVIEIWPNTQDQRVVLIHIYVWGIRWQLLVTPTHYFVP